MSQVKAGAEASAFLQLSVQFLGGEEPNVLQLRSGCHSSSVHGVDGIRASQPGQIYLSLW